MPDSVFVPAADLDAVLLAAIDPAMSHRADRVLARAQVDAPVDKGEYRASLHKEREGDGYRVQADADHSVFVEFGTRRMAAHRTLGRALDAAREG